MRKPPEDWSSSPFILTPDLFFHYFFHCPIIKGHNIESVITDGCFFRESGMLQRSVITCHVPRERTPAALLEWLSFPASKHTGFYFFFAASVSRNVRGLKLIIKSEGVADERKYWCWDFATGLRYQYC